MSKLYETIELCKSFLESIKPIAEKYNYDAQQSLVAINQNEELAQQLEKIQIKFSDPYLFGLIPKLQACPNEDESEELYEEFLSLPEDNKDLILLNLQIAGIFDNVKEISINTPKYWYKKFTKDK